MAEDLLHKEVLTGGHHDRESVGSPARQIGRRGKGAELVPLDSIFHPLDRTGSDSRPFVQYPINGRQTHACFAGDVLQCQSRIGRGCAHGMDA